MLVSVWWFTPKLPTMARLLAASVGTLDDGYIPKVPLPRVPLIQRASHVTHSCVELGTYYTCYLEYICVARWIDLTRLLADLGRGASSLFLMFD